MKPVNSPLALEIVTETAPFSDPSQKGTGSIVAFLSLLKTDPSEFRIDHFSNREVLPMIVAQAQMEVTPAFRC
jgi:hypothetical protein